MLNFSGQTRRRVINLGTKNGGRGTKRDILERADQERKRRAEERQRESAVLTLQRNIRKYRDLRRFGSVTFPQLTVRQRAGTLLVLRDRLFHFHKFDEAEFHELLRDSRESISQLDCNLGNVLVLRLLGYYEDDQFLVDTLPLTNVAVMQFDAYAFVMSGIVALLMRLGPQSLHQASADAVCSLLSVIKPMDDSWLADFFDSFPTDHPLCQGVVQYGLFPKEFVPGGNTLENLCYIAFNVQEVNKDLIVSYILDVLLSCDPDTFQLTGEYSSKMFETGFIETVLQFIRMPFEKKVYKPVLVMDKILALVLNQDKKNKILMILLVSRDFNTILYESLKELALPQNDSLVYSQRVSPEFRLARDLVQMYLQFATDADLLGHTKVSYIPLDLVLVLTDLLKRMIFSLMWRETAGKNVDPLEGIEKETSLLTQLYLRDSRAHILSGSDSNFWCCTDEQFLQVNLYSILTQYEEQFLDMDPMLNVYEKRDKVLNALLSEKLRGNVSRQYRKLAILIKTPFFIPFDQRVDYFYFLIETDRNEMGYGMDNPLMGWLGAPTINGGRRSATISREHVLEDAMNSFSRGSDLKSKLSVTFVNQFGVEEGIDGGGVTKEFLTSVIEEGFKDEDDKYRLFTTNDQHELYPVPTYDHERLRAVEFLGRIVGKCLYDHILVDLTFADFFLKCLLTGSEHFSIDDLKSLDSSLHSSLVKLLNMPGPEIDRLELCFEATDMFDPHLTRDLVPNGSRVPVTRGNVLEYVWRLTQYKLRSIAKPATMRFREGLAGLIPHHWFAMFNTVDLEMLISGGRRQIDLEDLQRNTEYGGYEAADETVRDFWAVLGEFDEPERRKFLKFVTSVPQAPLKGFSALEPKFGIRNSGQEDRDRLPTASTCVNLLKLPDYRDRRHLKQKLLYSINSGARFDLS
ncbi:ubiquitin-ubiquitin ligase HUL5 KNAG_0I00750 [Huiozyma naganishii CBS 8797]|uniref:HECT-type E3 ubiquitin transferase n=1 Tax=Huiozyma naganishii (strain ATCC MYA-139 / BCRC 22969 / CBS 8797 / KCTC 17520 / NBRC 10181 / NCYC 3082 / Yp74L-3) TaxID=1071383 RepID=J7SA25_HUIN7|nr:hypothetical protein KNAG_0I00750 [Kazachstania naganishii CBS 8797]CCK71866.1 hypothetical protein KNAG_0I00750 [Kazachstania naganishii CBS 8797]